jgi:hypothetical protein
MAMPASEKSNEQNNLHFSLCLCDLGVRFHFLAFDLELPRPVLLVLVLEELF